MDILKTEDYFNSLGYSRTGEHLYLAPKREHNEENRREHLYLAPKREHNEAIV
jgi:hypothetical protein